MWLCRTERARWWRYALHRSSPRGGCLFGGASFRPGTLRDCQIVRNDNQISDRPTKAYSILPGCSDASVDVPDDQHALIIGERWRAYSA